MPKAGTPEGRACVLILEWAYEDPDAEKVDPEGVAAYRREADALIERSAPDQEWGPAYSSALKIWKKGHKHHEVVQRAMELF